MEPRPGTSRTARVLSVPVLAVLLISAWPTLASASESPEGGREFTVAGTGDLLIHGPVHEAAATGGGESGGDYDFSPMFEQVGPVLGAADLSICHLEVPLSEDNSDLSGYPMFMGPRELAGDIAGAGYDACSTASNHSVDQGRAGVESTLAALDEAGVAHAGTARTEQEARQPRLHDAGGVTVGHISYTYGLNGLPLPEPWMVDLLDGDRILADARAARAAGAEFVVASLHWGGEYDPEPTGEQRELAERLLTDGAVDLILGHHAHVIQPIERIDDRVVVYGLGNFLSNQSADCCPAATQDGLIAVAHVRETAPGEFRVREVGAVPTWVDRDGGYVITDVASELAGEPTRARREVLETSLERTQSVLGDTGQDGLTQLVSGEDLAGELDRASLALEGDVESHEVFKRLPSHEELRLPVVDEHHRRSCEAVVVARHRMVVGPGGGHREEITLLEVLRHGDARAEHVAALAVLAHDGDQALRGGTRSVSCVSERVASAVEGMAGVIGHPPVHAHVGPLPRHVLHGADPVDGAARRCGDGAPRLHTEPDRTEPCLLARHNDRPTD